MRYAMNGAAVAAAQVVRHIIQIHSWTVFYVCVHYFALKLEVIQIYVHMYADFDLFILAVMRLYSE
jgi:hypothetical protein